MAQEDPNRLVEWYYLLRRQIPVVRQRFDEWWEAVREEPRLFWETVSVRYAAYTLGALVLIGGAAKISDLFAPPLPVGARAAATTADFHVVCTHKECMRHFVIHRRFGFSKFPVACPKCKRESGQRARRCNSDTCRGRWVAPINVYGGQTCPNCAEGLE